MTQTERRFRERDSDENHTNDTERVHRDTIFNSNSKRLIVVRAVWMQLWTPISNLFEAWTVRDNLEVCWKDETKDNIARVISTIIDISICCFLDGFMLPL